MCFGFFFFVLGTTSIIDHFIFAGIGCGLSMLGLGGYLQYRTYTTDPVATWFPVACIFLFTICCTLGFLIVPWVMIGEIYPQKVRGILGGMTTCSAHIFVFIVVKTYPLMSNVLNQHGTFILYGCVSILCKRMANCLYSRPYSIYSIYALKRHTKV